VSNEIEPPAFIAAVNTLNPVICTRTARLWTLVIALRFACGATDRIFADSTTATMIFRGIVISDRFEEQLVKQRCQEFLAQNKEKKLIVLTLVPKEAEGKTAVFGCDHCIPYPFWRRQYDAVANMGFPIAELIYINGNAVLRFRSGSGQVSVAVLAGNDPRQVSIETFKGRIVHVGMQGNKASPSLMLYVMGEGAIKSDSAAQFIADFSRSVGVDDANVDFRSDPWFINEIWRPWFPLFEEHKGEPPSEAEFNRTKTLSCARSFTMFSSKCTWTDVERLP
jgi:hypothetical protein